jgi:uncharacterized protein YfiM (DUF2279 family)
MIKQVLVLVLLIVFLIQGVQAQGDLNEFLQPAAKFNNARYSGVLIGTSVAYVLTMTVLYRTWYRKFPKSRFHFFNDNAEWFQMDKLGHATTSYNIGAGYYDLFRWSGQNNKQASYGAATVAMLFLTSIEVFDGFSQGWGFSWGDMAANTAGACLFAGQQRGYGEQRFSLKVGWRTSFYSSYNPDLLGDTWAQTLLKDYNSQQIWLSCNIASVLPVGKDFPKWLNIDAGQGVSGLIGGRENQALTDANGNPVKFERYRNWYLGADVDFTRIPTTIAEVGTLLPLVNVFRLPLPSVEYSRVHKVRFYPFVIRNE